MTALIQCIKEWYVRRLEQKAEHLQNLLRVMNKGYLRLQEAEKWSRVDSSLSLYEQLHMGQASRQLWDEMLRLQKKSRRIHRRIKRLKK